MINYAPNLNIAPRWQLINMSTGNEITFLYNPTRDTNIYDLKREVVLIEALDSEVFVKDIGDITINDIKIELKNMPQEFVDVIKQEYQNINNIDVYYKLITHKMDIFIVKWKNITIKPVRTAYVKYYIKQGTNFYPNNYYERHFNNKKADIYDIIMEFIKIYDLT